MKIYKVRDLMNELQKQDPDAEVVIRDPDDEECVIEISGDIHYSESERCVVIK